MKKLAFMFVAMMALSFVSCDENKPAAPAVETDSVEVVDTNAVDTNAVDTAAADTAAADTAAAQ